MRGLFDWLRHFALVADGGRVGGIAADMRILVGDGAVEGGTRITAGGLGAAIRSDVIVGAAGAEQGDGGGKECGGRQDRRARSGNHGTMINRTVKMSRELLRFPWFRGWVPRSPPGIFFSFVNRLDLDAADRHISTICPLLILPLKMPKQARRRVCLICSPRKK
jgi:hypothetical protein